MPIIRSSRFIQMVAAEQHPANRTHNPQLHTRPTTCKSKRQVPQAATICITLELLTMGIMMPKTCWANNKFFNKNQSVAPSWPFISTWLYYSSTVKCHSHPVRKRVLKETRQPYYLHVYPSTTAGKDFFLPILQAKAGMNEKRYIRNTAKYVNSRQSAKNFKVGRVRWRNSALQKKTPKTWHAEIFLPLLVFSGRLQSLPFARPTFVHMHSPFYFQMTQYQIFLPQVTTWNFGKTSSDAYLKLPNPVTFNGLLKPVSFTLLSTRNSNYIHKEWFMNCGRNCRKWCSGIWNQIFHTNMCPVLNCFRVMIAWNLEHMLKIFFFSWRYSYFTAL